MVSTPKKPEKFSSLLNRFDRYLDLEWLGDHWAIVDKRKIVSIFPMRESGITRYKKVYDRLCHLKKNEWLGTNVINKLRWMSMEQWKKPSDLIKSLETEEADAKAAKEREKLELSSYADKERIEIIDKGKWNIHVNRS